MPGIFKRIIKIAKAGLGEAIENASDFIKSSDGVQGKKYHDTGPFSSEYEQNFSGGAGSGTKKTGYANYPDQVVEDLGTFGLHPPSSLEEVKKARNREIRKYHPDRFLNDPDRLETSKQIMQILNAAYERLEKWFESRRQ